VVSANVASAVVGNGAVATERLAGGDRYLTAQAVVNRMIPYYSLQPTVLGIATGAGFADALSGGAALGTRGGVLLLTRPDALVPSAADAINLAKQYKPSVEILGGTSAISAQVENSVRSALI
jgi:putative cell wall-binding protein